jgi:hypothetical protein
MVQRLGACRCQAFPNYQSLTMRLRVTRTSVDAFPRALCTRLERLLGRKTLTDRAACRIVAQDRHKNTPPRCSEQPSSVPDRRKAGISYWRDNSAHPGPVLRGSVNDLRRDERAVPVRRWRCSRRGAFGADLGWSNGSGVVGGRGNSCDNFVPSRSTATNVVTRHKPRAAKCRKEPSGGKGWSTVLARVRGQVTFHASATRRCPALAPAKEPSLPPRATA